MFNGTNSARNCAIALQSYIDASDAWISNHLYSTVQTFLPSAETTTYTDYITTTLCDGIPRAISPHLSFLTTTGGGYLIPQVLASNYTEKPPCSLGPQYCTLQQEIFSSKLADYESGEQAWWSYITARNDTDLCTGISGVFTCNVPGAPQSPLAPSSPYCTPYTACSTCQITAGSVRLLYWPSTAVPNNNICPSPNVTNTTTFTAEPTGKGPNTQVFDGFTLTSPTAYMSFSGIVVSWCSNQSTIKTNTIIPVNPTDVSSLRSVPWPAGQAPGVNVPYINYEGPYSFDYGDFNTPMPYSAYTNAWFCFGDPSEFCAIMTPDKYGPILSYPKSFIQMVDPLLSSCTLEYGYRGVYDPPHALQLQPSAALPAPLSPSANPKPHTSETPADPITIPTTSASAQPPPVAPTPSPTTRRTPIANPSNAPPSPSSSPGQRVPGPEIPGDAPGGNTGAAQTKDPPPAQPAQQPSAGGVPTAEPDTQPGSHSGGNGDPQNLSPGNVLSSGGDPANGAGGEIASILRGAGGSPSHPADSDPAQDPGNPGTENRPGADGSSDGGAGIASILANGGTGSGEFDGNTGSSSGSTGAQIPSVVGGTGGQPIYRIPNDPGAVSIAGTTLRAGDHTEVAGTPVSVGNGYVVVGSGAQASTLSLAENVADPGGSGAVLTFGSKTFTAVQEPGHNGAVVIGDQIVSLGGAPITVAGHTVSLGNHGLTVDGSSTIALGPLVTGDTSSVAKNMAVISLGSSKVTAIEQDHGVVAIGTQTLSVGGPEITMDGHVVSLGSNGVVVDGSSTIGLEQLASADLIKEMKATAIITLGSSELTAFEESNGDMVIRTQTISIGGPAITVDGHVLSDGPNGVIVDGAKTVPWSSLSGAVAEEALITAVDGKVLTAIEQSNHAGTVVVDGSVTLMVGGPDATIDGEVISLGTGGLVVNGSVTEPFSIASTTTPTDGQSLGHATVAATSSGETKSSSVTSTSAALKIPRFALWILGFIYLLRG